MPTRNVVLTDHLATFVEKLVTAGRYQNASEVLRDGLRLLEAREAEEQAKLETLREAGEQAKLERLREAGEQAKLETLREAARIGVADIEAGRFRRFESGADLKRHLTRASNTALADRKPKPTA